MEASDGRHPIDLDHAPAHRPRLRSIHANGDVVAQRDRRVVEPRLRRDEPRIISLVPLDDLTHDGQPMGFDLTLQLKSAGRHSSRAAASVAVELTYNPLDR